MSHSKIPTTNWNHFMSDKFFPFLQKHGKWIVLLLAIGLLVGLIYLIGGLLHDPEGMINDFENAVRMGNVEELEGMITSRTEKLVLEKKQLKAFVDHAQKDKDYLDDLLKAMRAQLYYYEGEPWKISSDAPEDYLNYGDFYIHRKEIPLFYDSYEIVVRPYYITISTNEPDAVIKVNGQEKFRTAQNNLKYSFGPVMPGKYDVLVEKKFEYAQLSSQEEIEAFDYRPQTIDKDLGLYGEKISVESDFEDTQIVINGKDTNKTTGSLDKFGPISRNGTIKIQGKHMFPWGEERSMEQVVDEDTSSVDLTPIAFNSQESKTQATETINSFFRTEMVALVQQDVNKLNNASDNLKKKYAEQISRLKKYDSYWKGKTLGTRIDYSQAKIRLNSSNNQYEVSIPVEVHYLSKEYGGILDKDSDPLEDNYQEFIVTIVYQEPTKSWVIDKIDPDYSGGSSSYMTSNLVVKSEFK